LPSLYSKSPDWRVAPPLGGAFPLGDYSTLRIDALKEGHGDEVSISLYEWDRTISERFQFANAGVTEFGPTRSSLTVKVCVAEHDLIFGIVFEDQPGGWSSNREELRSNEQSLVGAFGIASNRGKLAF